MKLLVQREPSKDGATLGKLYADGEFVCDTLEDVVREVEGQPVSAWKVYGETAIPQGTYAITLENSPRFGPNTLTVNGVEGFEKIRVHAGNTDDDTHGCLLVGSRNSDNTIANSRATLSVVKIKVLGAKQRGSEVTIEYVNAGMYA